MKQTSHACLLAARAAPASLPRCTLRSHHRERTKLLAAETETLIVEQAQEQQVPLHIARRLRALEQEVQQAYEAGYKAGYTAGVKVQVNVDMELSSSRTQQQTQQQQQDSSSSRRQDSQQAAAAAAAQSDSLARSAVKGLVWRLFSTTATMGIALLIFHDFLQVEDALKLGVLEFSIKFVLYFAHERIWAALKIL